jgi:hypothetical protein
MSVGLRERATFGAVPLRRLDPAGHWLRTLLAHPELGVVSLRALQLHGLACRSFDHAVFSAREP